MEREAPSLRKDDPSFMRGFKGYFMGIFMINLDK
jgi:hypothetical protein